MSGHSKWSTIKRQKAATDQKRGAVFTKLGKQLSIAARGGADPSINSALAMAIEKAKAANMPVSNIERAIQRVTDKSATQLEEVMYEGYGPGGAGILVECATDNLNRTLPEVRNAFTKHGGNFAEKGAVAYQFEHKGMIRLKGKGDDAMMMAIDAGADDVVEDGEDSIVYTTPKNLAAVRDALKQAGGEVIEAELTYAPKNTVMIEDKDTANKIMRLMEALEDLDDVTATHTNFDIPPELIV